MSTTRRERNDNFLAWGQCVVDGRKTRNAPLGYDIGILDSEASHEDNRAVSGDDDSVEWQLVELISPSDDELDHLADELPAPPDWYEERP